MKYYYKNLKNCLSYKDIQEKWLILKNTPFLYWPSYFQRLTMFAGIFLCCLFFTYFFESTKEIFTHKEKIIALREKIQSQQQTIQQSKLIHENKKKPELLSRVNALNLSNFMSHIAILAKQNHIEIEAIKPLPLEEVQEKNIDFEIHPFQINAIGEYDHLLQFMQNISKLPDLVIIHNFQMTLGLVKNGKTRALKFLMVIYLYE